MRIIWDENKNRENIRKHHVSFETIRRISARKATTKETKYYGG
jgi:uncharacterized DUF497 family protein